MPEPTEHDIKHQKVLDKIHASLNESGYKSIKNINSGIPLKAVAKSIRSIISKDSAGATARSGRSKRAEARNGAQFGGSSPATTKNNEDNYDVNASKILDESILNESINEGKSILDMTAPITGESHINRDN